MHSTHPIDQQEVMAYLDGELPVERATVVAGHLEQCAECRSVAEDFRIVGRQLLAWQVEPSPTRFADRVRALLESPAQAKAQVAQKKSLWGGLVSQKLLMRPWVWGLAGTASVALLLLSIPKLVVMRHANRPLTALPVLVPSEAAHQREEPQKTLELPQFALNLRAPAGEPGEPLLTAPSRVSIEREWRENHPAVAQGAAAVPSLPSGPMIVRTAELVLFTREFDNVREAVERTLRQHHGYVGQLNVNAPAGAGRTLTTTLRVPAEQFDAVLRELKTLGRVEREWQAGEDVTKRYVDLGARLSNARYTEQRLLDILRQRTGKVADILAVEQEIARVRGEIESMEADKKSLENRVSFATLQLKLIEEYKAQLEVAPPSVGTRVHNAAVEGYKSAAQTVLALVLTLLSAGPTLLFWLLILLALYCLSRVLWRRHQARLIRRV